jgi:hypothetical protein
MTSPRQGKVSIASEIQVLQKDQGPLELVCFPCRLRGHLKVPYPDGGGSRNAGRKKEGAWARILRVLLQFHGQGLQDASASTVRALASRLFQTYLSECVGKVIWYSRRTREREDSCLVTLGLCEWWGIKP